MMVIYLNRKKQNLCIKCVQQYITFTHSTSWFKAWKCLMTTTNEKADLRVLDFGLSKIIEPEEKYTEPYGILSDVATEFY